PRVRRRARHRARAGAADRRGRGAGDRGPGGAERAAPPPGGSARRGRPGAPTGGRPGGPRRFGARGPAGAARPGAGVSAIPTSAADLPLVRSTRVGGVRVHALEAGLQRLDGGAMFGVVPKPLWEKRIPADERNRIPLALRCLLVEAPGALVLIDTGIGNKGDAKFTDLY